jgi:hypothetical protein
MHRWKEASAAVKTVDWAGAQVEEEELTKWT